MIILLNGPPYSGKDTAARLIKKLTRNENKHFTEYKFSRPLKNAIASLFSLTISEVSDLEADKEAPQRLFNNLSYREVQIALSEDYMKGLFGTEILGEIAVRVIKGRAGHVVVSDCGFMEEVYPLLRQFPSGVGLIRIHRPDCSYTNDSRNYLPDYVLDKHLVIDIDNKYDLDLYEVQLRRALEQWHILKKQSC